MSHDELCRLALRWLSGHRHCYPVYANCASCAEIPDAIGWSSRQKYRGSHVVECKTSRADFIRDKRKSYQRMGDYRFFLSLPDVLTAEMVAEHFPDHGLIHLVGRRVRYAREAPLREAVNLRSEVRFLRYAIVNGKRPWMRLYNECRGQAGSDASATAAATRSGGEGEGEN